MVFCGDVRLISSLLGSQFGNVMSLVQSIRLIRHRVELGLLQVIFVRDRAPCDRLPNRKFAHPSGDLQVCRDVPDLPPAKGHHLQIHLCCLAQQL